MVKLHFLIDSDEHGIRAGEQVWFDIERAAKLVKTKVAEVVEGELADAKADAQADDATDAKATKKGK